MGVRKRDAFVRLKIGKASSMHIPCFITLTVRGNIKKEGSVRREKYLQSPQQKGGEAFGGREKGGTQPPRRRGTFRREILRNHSVWENLDGKEQAKVAEEKRKTFQKRKEKDPVENGGVRTHSYQKRELRLVQPASQE